MGKIVFFEDKNFEGRSYECSSDCPDLRSFINTCGSVKVESGCWVLYERCDYGGFQYVLSPGEYPEHQQWMGFNDTINSCRSINNDFDGQTAECDEDCPSVFEAFKFREFHSCVVTDGAWVLFEKPDYHGQQYFLDQGEYHSYTAWGAGTPTAGSLRMVTEF
uniref:Beta/gamma crystallin 'Greek key' domain-containing protein n=1 Tax=Knipowitschia caucasica TaxID=637954 RepID=A0AAV2JZS6_KNICA